MISLFGYGNVPKEVFDAIQNFKGNRKELQIIIMHALTRGLKAEGLRGQILSVASTIWAARRLRTSAER